MWLLLRVAFWLGVIILLLPASPTRQLEPARIIRSVENASHRFSNCTHGERNTLGANCSERAKRMRSQDTLTRDDLAVRWRGQRGARLESPILRTASSATCIDISAMRRVL